MSNANEKTFKTEKKKLLHDTLGFKTADLADAKNSLHEVEYCTALTHMQSSQIGMSTFSSWIDPTDTVNFSFFLSPCGLSGGATHTMNFKTDKLGMFGFASKHLDAM